MLSITQPNSITMTSVDFLEKIINPARSQSGEGTVRYNDFITRVKAELDTTHDEIFVMESTGGRTRQAVYLDYDQMMLVGMRESKSVRKAVLAKLHELEIHQSPKLSQDEQLLQLANGVIRLTKERDDAIRTKAQINDKRTATLMNKASQDAKKIKKLESQLQNQGEYLSIMASGLPQRIDTEFKINVQTWRVLKQMSTAMNRDIIKVEDPRYGEVNTYHVDVIDEFKAVYL